MDRSWLVLLAAERCLRSHLNWQLESIQRSGAFGEADAWQLVDGTLEHTQAGDSPGVVFCEDWSSDRGRCIRRVRRAHDEGFTLLEVTIVLLISGLLAAIALPSFLNQASKAKQVEAKMYLGTMNRAQQGYMLERARFADSVERTLGITTLQQSQLQLLDSCRSVRVRSMRFTMPACAGCQPAAVCWYGSGCSRTAQAMHSVDTILCESKTAQPGTGRATASSVRRYRRRVPASTEPVGQ